jgi:hypothetical protein
MQWAIKPTLLFFRGDYIMVLEEIKSRVNQVWDYEIWFLDERDKFMCEISSPIEKAIANNDRVIIDYILTLYPIERFLLQIAIEYGYKANPAAEVLINQLVEDAKYNDVIFKAIEKKCGLKVFCGNKDTCAVINENLVDGMQLTKKEVELYKKWDRVALSEWEYA